MLTPVKFTLVFFFRKYSMHPTLAALLSSAKFPIFPRATSFTKIVVYSPSRFRKHTSTSAPLLIKNLRETKFFLLKSFSSHFNLKKSYLSIYFKPIILFYLPENIRKLEVFYNFLEGYKGEKQLEWLLSILLHIFVCLYAFPR